MVPEGTAISGISQTNAATMYNPEQNVLAFGVCQVGDIDGSTGPRIHQFEGSTKTMRKLKAGDLLQLGTISNIVSGAALKGVVQFFVKT